jgi:hypothetical protein
MKKAYYARPISLYSSFQDLRDIKIIKDLGFELLNPNKEELQNRYKIEGMNVFLESVKECDIFFYRSFPDLKISAGVQKEIDQAIDNNCIILELPTLIESRVLSVEDTRNYLKYLGHR